MEEFNCVLTFVLDDPGKFWLSSQLFVICILVCFVLVFLVLPFSDGDDIVNAPHDVEILRCWVQSAGARVSSQAKYEEEEEEEAKRNKGKVQRPQHGKKQKNKVFRGRTIL